MGGCLEYSLLDGKVRATCGGCGRLDLETAQSDVWIERGMRLGEKIGFPVELETRLFQNTGGEIERRWVPFSFTRTIRHILDLQGEIMHQHRYSRRRPFIPDLTVRDGESHAECRHLP